MIVAAVVAVLVASCGMGARIAWAAGSAAAARARLDVRLEVAAARGWRRPPRWLAAGAEQAGVSVASVEDAWPGAALVAGGGAVTAAVVFGLPGLVAVMALVAAAPAAGMRVLAARERRRRAGALPALLEDVARGLRSGASLRQALALSVDRADVTLRAGLRSVCDTVAHGGRLEHALETWCERTPCDGLSLAVAALCLGMDAGGVQSRALDAVASGLRERLAVQRELTALSSQARASAGVMAAAPVVFAAFTVSADPRTAHFLLGTPPGLACLMTGLALDALAAGWMARITGAVR